MSEKVLGFKTKKAKIRDSGSKEYFTITLKRKNLIPVRLRKESVDLKKLKEYRKSYIKDNQYIEGGLVSTILDDLIEWAEKEAKNQVAKK